ncbi:MAG: peroxide stress protein YaaA [Austwickia sp.]|nr:peroxide stress protein YaaA [Austwickia sp.]
MLILLPSSQTMHRHPSGRAMSLPDLSFPALTPTRSLIAEVLIAESAEPYATATLRISPALAAEVAGNTRLLTDPAMLARDLYIGTLYRCLDLPSLTGLARRRANHWIVIQSPLYGALRPSDRIAPYRLSMNSPLPHVAPLANRWREPLGHVLPTAIGAGLLVDCRSGVDATAWSPRGSLALQWVKVRVNGSAASAKQVHGQLTRHLIEDLVDAQSPQDLRDYLARHFDVQLSRRDRGVREWLLDVTPREDDSGRSRTRPALRHLTNA